MTNDISCNVYTFYFKKTKIPQVSSSGNINMLKIIIIWCTHNYDASSKIVYFVV